MNEINKRQGKHSGHSSPKSLIFLGYAKIENQRKIDAENQFLVKKLQEIKERQNSYSKQSKK